jgi:PncC family amidohydrolase
MANLSLDARQLAKALKRKDVKVVFAESCTGGLIAATLAQVPGISDWLCGSAVTYRSDTKRQWLGVSGENLIRRGPVSATIAREMAVGVLDKTPEADWSASVTGHLGPDAPRRLDGVVYIGIALRCQTELAVASIQVRATRHVLAAGTRVHRQREAAALVMQQLLAAIGQQDR